MRVKCPKCGHLTHATNTLADNFWEIKRCMNRRDKMLKNKIVQESCNYSGYVKAESQNFTKERPPQ